MVDLSFGFRSMLTSIVAISSFLLTATSAEGGVLQPKENLTVNPKLSAEDKEATNVSGAACFIVAGERKSCLLIGDEVRYARLFSIDGKTLVPGQKIFLLPERDSNGHKFKETDAEGIAFAKNFYYAVGSHGLNKDGDKQLSRYFVYRVRIDPLTGRPSDLGSEETASTGVERSNTLDALIAADPVLKGHIGKVPGEQGVNIEGLAVSGDDMFFGFRGPVVNDTALVRQVPIEAIFEGKTAPLRPHSLRLGKGMGIRDLAAVKDGFLVLSGPEERKPAKAEVFFWKPDAEPIALADLGGPRSDEGQPEVLMVLDETDRLYSVLVMSDGPDGGEPMRFEIAKKK
jgi:hypothetical protein